MPLQRLTNASWGDSDVIVSALDGGTRNAFMRRSAPGLPDNVD
jgi:hypothetical protein